MISADNLDSILTVLVKHSASALRYKSPGNEELEIVVTPKQEIVVKPKDDDGDDMDIKQTNLMGFQLKTFEDNEDEE